ncbi:MAG: NAD(P)-dependent oxidoreductase [Caldilineaceae bacterium]|nr:NAD(P)-dependent oxidoreductase [Caldilineaceae bacterium]HRJ42423.1 NAD(P)-dependent oxidoreductase [Caldilineaceae bacterium]
MSDERFFLTGALGCIGAWVTRNLLRDGASVTIFDLGSNRSRLELLMEPEEVARIRFVQADITHTDGVRAAMAESGSTHIIHLAALQVPFCRANPPLGAAVNVVGTVNVFEAAKQLGIRQVVYASSIAVYGYADEYAEDRVGNDAHLHPLNHYGVYKQANEGTARIYWQDDAIASIALRPYTIYGPARDQGMTSTPTKAMLAAARGESYQISFRGVNGFQYADDVARTFIQAARTPFQGAGVYNLAGSIVDMSEVVAAIEAAEPSAAGRITTAEAVLPFPLGFDDSELRKILGDIPFTPLEQGVADTISLFKAAIAAGKLPKETLSE